MTTLVLIFVTCIALWIAFQEFVAFMDKNAKNSADRYRATERYKALQSQGKHCPPEVLEEAKRKAGL